MKSIAIQTRDYYNTDLSDTSDSDEELAFQKISEPAKEKRINLAKIINKTVNPKKQRDNLSNLISGKISGSNSAKVTSKISGVTLQARSQIIRSPEEVKEIHQINIDCKKINKAIQDGKTESELINILETLETKFFVSQLHKNCKKN